MIFDCNRDDVPNRGIIYDADGGLIPYPISGDLETGEVICFATDYEGNRIENSEGEFLRAERRYKPPLHMDPIPALPPGTLRQWLNSQPAARPLPS